MIKLLGAGGMGRVFLAVSKGGRPVAVKVIHPELASDPDFRERFRREVAAARKVSALYTAHVVDADVDGAVPWLATVYIPGPSLGQAVRKHGPLPLPSLVAMAAGLAEGLAAIHAEGVVHRDLTPNNVLLAEDGPRIIDFGISRAADASTHSRSKLFGTPGYHPPELLATGGHVGPAGDMFSLGAVLAFAASGAGPFGSGATQALLYRVVHEQPDLAGVPPEVSDLIRRCLAKNPAERPTATEMLEELAAAEPRMGWLPGRFTRDFYRYAVPAEAIQTATTVRRPAPPPRPARIRGTDGIATATVLGFMTVAAVALMATAGIGAGAGGRIPVGLMGGYSSGNVITSPASLQMGIIACFGAGLLGTATVCIGLGPIVALTSRGASAVRIVLADLAVIALSVLCFTLNGAIRVGVISGWFTLTLSFAALVTLVCFVWLPLAVSFEAYGGLPIRLRLPADPLDMIVFLGLGGLVATVVAAGLGAGYHAGIAAGIALGLGATCGLALTIAGMIGLRSRSWR